MLFKDDYFFLSTFYTCPICLTIDGKECRFTNVEAAYQAQKVPEIADRFSQVKGLEAKRMEGRLKISRKDWDTYHLFAMANALHAKFESTYLRALLKAIKDPIIHDNYWGDEYWGVCKNSGKNILGKLLMVIRDTDNDINALYDYISKNLLTEVNNNENC